jgi:hypothetical protein
MSMCGTSSATRGATKGHGLSLRIRRASVGGVIGTARRGSHINIISATMMDASLPLSAH